MYFNLQEISCLMCKLGTWSRKLKNVLLMQALSSMASAPASSGWLKGKVKAVPSGDCLVIMALSKAEIPPEKSITLSSLIAPRLV